MKKIWIYRFALFIMLFGLSSLSYGGNYDNPFVSILLNVLVNLSPLISILIFVPAFFRLPGLYKIIAWAIVLGVILLVLESKYEYNQWVYSYFVIKRFAYCGLALAAYCIASRAEPLTIRHAVNFVFIFFFINQILIGRIFRYDFSSETRTTLAEDAYYFVIPFLYYLIRYLKEHRLTHLFIALFSFLFIIAMLHRTVISAAVVGAGMIGALLLLGKVSTGGLPTSRTLAVFALLIAIASPFTGLLPEKKADAVLTNIGGILSPKQDNTGSWRLEQAEHYMKLVPDKPLFGWRYEGYDRGEIMENEDFPDKGTIIHSHYVDMLFNYGAFGMLLNLALILGALVALYRSGHTLSTDHLVLFGFITSGLVFSVSYQLPVYYWAFVGVGMHLGLKRPPVYFTTPEPTEEVTEYDADSSVLLSKNHTYS